MQTLLIFNHFINLASEVAGGGGREEKHLPLYLKPIPPPHVGIDNDKNYAGNTCPPPFSYLQVGACPPSNILPEVRETTEK